MPQDIYYRYFVFSRTQMETIRIREEKLGRRAKFGKVIVDGVPKSTLIFFWICLRLNTLTLLK